MMTIPEIMDYTRKVADTQGKLPFRDKELIQELHKEVLDIGFEVTTCSDCYRDAAIRIFTYLKKHGKMKEKREYALLNGALIQMAFGSSSLYTNANLTDEVAEEYLAIKPEKIILFAKYPEDWKARCSQRQAAKNGKKSKTSKKA